MSLIPTEVDIKMGCLLKKIIAETERFSVNTLLMIRICNHTMLPSRSNQGDFDAPLILPSSTSKLKS